MLSISIGFSQLSIKDKQIYNNTIDKYYSDDEFIEFLNSDSNFVSNEFFLSYKKSVSRLKFKKSKYIYGFSLMSILAGYDGIVNPVEYLDEESPPGADNIALGILLSSSYYGYHKIKKNKSLYHAAQQYNDLYSKGEAPNLNSPYNQHWSSSTSCGFLNEKIPMSFLDFSLSLHISEHSQFYGTFHYLVFGGGIGLGYKYHYLSKIESSPFISICAHSSIMGDGYERFSGISYSPGYSISLSRRVFVNLGMSFTYDNLGSLGSAEDEYPLVILPFINLESKF